MNPRNPSHLSKHLWPLAAMLLTVSLPSAFGLEALLTDDSTIYSGSSAGTQGDDTMQLVHSTSTKCSVLRFEIASLLPTTVTADNVATATLRLFVNGTAPSGTGSINIHTIKASKSWNEGNAAGVWVSGTDFDSTPVLSGVGVANFSEKSYTALDVTSAVKGWITTPSDNNGFIIRPSGTIALNFQTKEAGTMSHNATLEITLKGDVGEVPGLNNTIYGFNALHANNNSFGGSNSAFGANALAANTDGNDNLAVGAQALIGNTTGYYNVGVGNNTLYTSTNGYGNLAFGYYSLYYNTGSYNIAIGTNSGYQLTTGSYNIHIGHSGFEQESGTIRIGTQNTQSATFIAGIYNTTSADGVAVYINAGGHLGTLTSSARFKQDISDMNDSSEAILSLRPVNFRYKKEIDSRMIPQYGLIAEEVAEIAPDLVARDAKGETHTVRYEAVNAMLLNEFKKEHARVQTHEQKLAAQEQTIAQQQEQIRKLTQALTELDSRVRAGTGQP